MGSNCPNGSEPRAGVPFSYVIKQSDITGFAGRRGSIGNSPAYGLIDAGLTSDLCGASPESSFIPPRFPGDSMAALFNAYVVSLWNSRCQCKAPPPQSFEGGQCFTSYNVTVTISGRDYRAPDFEPFSVSQSGVVLGPLRFAQFFDVGPSGSNIEYLGISCRNRFNQNSVGATGNPAKPGTSKASVRISRADGLADTCGDTPNGLPELPRPATPYIVAPMFTPPVDDCPCKGELPQVLPGQASFPENYLADLKRFADFLRNLPKIEVPRPDFLPKALADYFNFANLISWMKFVEPGDKKMDANCCAAILAKLNAIEVRGNLTGQDLSYVKAFVEKMYLDSGNDRRDFLTFLRSIASQTFRIDNVTKTLPQDFQGVQNGLYNIFNRQATYQGETNRNFLTVGAALGAMSVAAAAAAAAAAKTLATIVAQNLSTLGQLAALRAYLEVFRQSLQIQLNAISESIKGEVRLTRELLRSEIQALEGSISQVRRDVSDLNQIVQARLNQLNNLVQTSRNSILDRVDVRSSEVKSLIAALINGFNQLVQSLGLRLQAIEKSISSLEEKIRGILPAIASLRERMDKRFDGLIECLEIPGSGDVVATVIGSGASGRVELPPRCVGVRFRAISPVPDDKSKKQSGRGQPDVIQGGWCWLSFGGFLSKRMSLDSRNKLFSVDLRQIGGMKRDIVWTGANLISYEVSAIIAPQPKKPPFEERPCQS